VRSATGRITSGLSPGYRSATSERKKSRGIPPAVALSSPAKRKIARGRNNTTRYQQMPARRDHSFEKLAEALPALSHPRHDDGRGGGAERKRSQYHEGVTQPQTCPAVG